MTNPRKIADLNIILHGVVGSGALGCSVGSDDRDEMGVFIETPEQVMGLIAYDHRIIRDQPNGVRSQPGDLDLTLYSLRKFCRLALKGNPHVLILLWLPEYIVGLNQIADRLIELREQFINKQTFSSFLGYLRSQKRGMLGKQSPKISRPELIENYGFDTKYAYHAVRLAMQGCELGFTRKLVLPMCEAEFLKSIRNGMVPLARCIEIIEAHESALLEYRRTASEADPRPINEFLVWAHKLAFS